MKKNIGEGEVLRMLREEWLKEVSNLFEKNEKSKKQKKKPKNVKLKPDIIDNLTKGLRIKEKDSGYEYTIHSVSNEKVKLLTPEKEIITVSKNVLQSGYTLD